MYTYFRPVSDAAEEVIRMRTVPMKCKDINTVSGFCSCIENEDDVDAAARAFCERAGSNPYATGDDLSELKKALMDLEE